MLADLLGAARDFGRLRDITIVLVRYGFSDVVQRMGLASALDKIGETLHWKEAEDLAHMHTPQRIRGALQDLGPTFIKLGQLMSTRVDMFPPEWIDEFEQLQDHVPPSDYEALHEQLTEDLGKPPEEAFAEFDPEPLAAASIAQVHRATLHDGRKVVVKVRRPGIEDTVLADLRLLQRLAQIAKQNVTEAAHYRLPELVKQFRRSILMELDLAAECRNAERLGNNLEARYPPGETPITVPTVYWEFTGKRVNVQDYIDGIPGRDMKAVEEAGLDRHYLAVAGARAVLSTILEDGFFHADPHPGNIFFLTDNRIAFIDFGMVGYLSDHRREQFVGLLRAIVDDNEEDVADALVDLCEGQAAQTESLIEDVSIFLHNYHGVGLKYLDLTAVIHDLLSMLRRHELHLPLELAQTFKVFITLEGLGRRLDPEFNLVAESAPIVKRAFATFYSPTALARRGQRSLIEAVKLMARLPREFRDTLQSMARGTLQVHIDVTQLERLAERLDRAASRVTVGLITSALIIGSAIVMTVDEGPQVLGLPLFGALGFLGAGIGGIWVLASNPARQVMLHSEAQAIKEALNKCLVSFRPTGEILVSTEGRDLISQKVPRYTRDACEGPSLYSGRLRRFLATLEMTSYSEIP
ncbi:MAG: AarF/ABC1/UbiB kinase family protein [Gammaproteobacteria bacterium]|nr:AarF/ABC1/UbiB kinase family protein [Gammaproteobacteria bacterium]